MDRNSFWQSLKNYFRTGGFYMEIEYTFDDIMDRAMDRFDDSVW